MNLLCNMRKFFLLLAFSILVWNANARKAQPSIGLAAEKPEAYLPLLANKRVGMVVNQTSTAFGMHLVDYLIEEKVNIVKIFGPEHGFRGEADAGEKVNSTKDEATGIAVISLYGNHKKPTVADFKDVDIVLFNIQDVGARFYTYISTLQYVMEACAEQKKKLIVIDCPNPNGYYVDGPVLDMKHKSFVGMQPIPIVHGMTIGEYAGMLNGQGWLAGKKKCNVTVIKCDRYTHKMNYSLPIPPSPNLRSPNAIALYPSLCLFEGTIVSVGRGTDRPFEQWGHPDFVGQYNHSFIPQPGIGSKDPLYNNKACYGLDLIKSASEIITDRPTQINLSYLMSAYNACKDKTKFFNNFFTNLAGSPLLQKQIQSGKSEKEIRASWAPGLKKFKAIRKKYLLYPDFE